MFRSAAFLIAWLLAVPAFAGMPPGMRNPQVRPANASAGLPAVDDNLGAGGYPIAGGICAEWGHQVPCNDHYSTTRASTKYVMASDGLFTSVPSNVLALANNTGGLIEEARTNLALWSRDLTQSGTWIAVTMTAAKNAVGIDGTANSATTLTSSSAAGTILQSLTQASAAYTYTVYVKGVTVTGAIQVADYPVLTPSFTTLSSANCFNPAGVGVAPASGQTGFLRCTVTATSLNPVIGFKFANSGDSIIADFNQLEAGSFGTSPIATTNATATRAADVVSLAGLPLTAMQASAGTALTIGSVNGNTGVIQALLKSSTGGTVGSSAGESSNAFAAVSLASVASLFNFGRRWVTGNTEKEAFAWQSSNYAGCLSAGVLQTSSNSNTPVNSSFTLGSYSNSNFLDGTISRLVFWSTRIPNAQVTAECT